MRLRCKIIISEVVLQEWVPPDNDVRFLAGGDLCRYLICISGQQQVYNYWAEYKLEKADTAVYTYWRSNRYGSWLCPGNK